MKKQPITGPLSNLTHTECAGCGDINCQEPEHDPYHLDNYTGPDNMQDLLDDRTSTPEAD